MGQIAIPSSGGRTPQFTAIQYLDAPQGTISYTPNVDTIYSYHANSVPRGTYDGRSIRYASKPGTVTGGYNYNGCEYVKAGTTITFDRPSGFFIFVTT